MNILQKLFGGKPKVQKVDLRRRFNLVSRTGQGTMSQLWRATDTLTGKTVALKILDKQKTARHEQRFVGMDKPSEGEIAITLDHPNIVKTFEHGISKQDEQFLVMEWLEGVSLTYLVDTQNELMQRRRFPLILELGEAIAHIHDKGWIHRDICPRNVMICGEHAKLIDFGLVVPNTEPFQKPGNRTGTANYMAPELVKRQKTDQRLDLFSYAVLCYEMYSKTLPWPHGDSIESVVGHINTPPKDIREHCPDIEPGIADVIMRGLERTPADRWQTARKMVDAFKAAAPAQTTTEAESLR